MTARGSPQPTYYEVLGLSPSVTSQQDDPSQFIKCAYRRALLNHHPDKNRHPPSSANAPRNPTTATHNTSTSTFTVDQISTAYAILSNPTSRATYDQHLLLLRNQTSIPGASNNNNTAHHDFQTGIETVDLDDLSVSVVSVSRQEVDSATTNEGETITTTQQQWWYRSCRCGNPQGYRFTETDLEEAIDLGELMVGCVDCSLWLRVLFSVVVEEEDADDEDESQTG